MIHQPIPDTSGESLYEALQTFFQTLDTSQQAVADSINGHGERLRLAHDNYDQSEVAIKMSIAKLFQALRDPNVIQ